VTLSLKFTTTVMVSPALYRPSLFGDVTDATVAADVSIVTSIDVDVDVFPAASVSVTEILQMPSPKVANVQAFEEIVQETLVESAFDAVRIAVPAKVPPTLNVGVLSLVRLSVFDCPKSDPAARSGVAGVAIVLALITRLLKADDAADSTPLTF
jgi:hypothetical protein